jgi:hypothetical protein
MSPAYFAAALLIVLGIGHSYLGERYILIRLFKREHLPKLFGGTAFTTGTLRFAWHLTSVAWWALAYLAVISANAAPTSRQVLGSIGIACLVSAVFPVAFTRGRHLSWIVFLISGCLLLWAAGGR